MKKVRALPEPRVRRPTAVDQAADALRSMSLARREGELLGSEEELMSQLHVSRPTLRQAAGLVAQDRMIKIRRGVNGGYFSARPDSMTVARMAAIYLQSRAASLDEVIRAIDPIRTELARLASRQTDPQLRARLESFLEQERVQGGELRNYREFLRVEHAFGRVLGEVSGNEVLALFMGILYDLSGVMGRTADIYVNRPERMEQYRQLRNRMAAAILAGDEELAVISTKRCTTIVTDWMQEDLVAVAADHGAAAARP